MPHVKHNSPASARGQENESGMRALLEERGLSALGRALSDRLVKWLQCLLQRPGERKLRKSQDGS